MIRIDKGPCASRSRLVAGMITAAMHVAEVVSRFPFAHAGVGGSCRGTQRTPSGL